MARQQAINGEAKAMAYMTGWKAGSAGLRVFPDQLAVPAFKKGLRRGQDEKRLAYDEACAMFKVKVDK